MPPLLGFDYLAAAWSECGAYEVGVNGILPLSWQEIHAYNAATGNRLCSYDCRLISLMSRLYCDQYHKSTDGNCKQPYVSEAVAKPKADDQSERIKAMFRNLSS